MQQTQVARVIPKYRQFLERFPTPLELASADFVEILRLWSGLGYNRRAKYLYTAALAVMERHNGKFPSNRADLLTLPGIGAYTSGAIMAFAFNQPVAFMDTNIRRVYLHHFFAEENGITDRVLLGYVAATVDRRQPRQWYWALMSYGRTLFKRGENANKRSAHYSKQTPFLGSNRQFRGAILRSLIERGSLCRQRLASATGFSEKNIERAIEGLVSDGMIVCENENIYLARR